MRRRKHFGHRLRCQERRAASAAQPIAPALSSRAPLICSREWPSSDTNMAASTALHGSRRRFVFDAPPSPHRAPHWRRARRSAPRGCISTWWCSSTRIAPRCRDCSGSPSTAKIPASSTRDAVCDSSQRSQPLSRASWAVLADSIPASFCFSNVAQLQSLPPSVQFL